jgi:hypothetical protein
VISTQRSRLFLNFIRDQKEFVAAIPPVFMMIFIASRQLAFSSHPAPSRRDGFFSLTIGWQPREMVSAKSSASTVYKSSALTSFLGRRRLRLAPILPGRRCADPVFRATAASSQGTHKSSVPQMYAVLSA